MCVCVCFFVFFFVFFWGGGVFLAFFILHTAIILSGFHINTRASKSVPFAYNLLLEDVIVFGKYVCCP